MKKRKMKVSIRTRPTGRVMPNQTVASNAIIKVSIRTRPTGRVMHHLRNVSPRKKIFVFSREPAL